MLYDEKAANTAHVALGRNKHMGGVIESVIHCDMAILNPTILVDGKPVMEVGQLTIRGADWHESYRSFPVPELLDAGTLELFASGEKSKTDSEGRLRRVLMPPTGRVSDCIVGDDDTARLANHVLNVLSHSEGWMALKKVAEVAQMDLKTVYQVATVLCVFGLAKSRATVRGTEHHV
jgi:hypothetical protein